MKNFYTRDEIESESCPHCDEHDWHAEICGMTEDHPEGEPHMICDFCGLVVNCRTREVFSDGVEL